MLARSMVTGKCRVVLSYLEWNGEDCGGVWEGRGGDARGSDCVA